MVGKGPSHIPTNSPIHPEYKELLVGQSDVKNMSIWPRLDIFWGSMGYIWGVWHRHLLRQRPKKDTPIDKHGFTHTYTHKHYHTHRGQDPTGKINLTLSDNIDMIETVSDHS